MGSLENSTCLKRRDEELYDNDGSNCHRYPSKCRKLDVVTPSRRVELAAESISAEDTSNIKLLKVGIVRNVLKTFGAIFSRNGQQYFGNSPATCDDERKVANDNDGKVISKEYVWKFHIDKLTSVVQLAKEYLSVFDVKIFSPSRASNRVERTDLLHTGASTGELNPQIEKSVEVEMPQIKCVISTQKVTGHRTKKVRSLSRKSMRRLEVCVVDDISQGMESIPILAMNGIDDTRCPSFTYVSNIVHPSWYQQVDPLGCNCTMGCSDSELCHCVVKNGGEIPYNEKGRITRAKPLVHECSSSCKCPPSCMNRVSQNGPRHQLEIFKTVDRGWGVRSRNYVPSGSFICEYIGELLQDKEAEQRIDNDEYLFDIGGGRGEASNEDGFAIDAANYGNIGRFINHSCSPNLYAQEVLYDHDDKRMPHIMFFATKNIYSLHELSYDYNYKVDRVCNVDGNIKRKNCHCGARKCTGRLY